MRKSALSDIVAANVTSRRLSMSLSKAQLARISGVSRATIVRTEGRKFMPLVETLRLLAGCLGCEVDDLLSSPESNHRPRRKGSR